METKTSEIKQHTQPDLKCGDTFFYILNHTILCEYLIVCREELQTKLNTTIKFYSVDLRHIHKGAYEKNNERIFTDEDQIFTNLNDLNSFYLDKAKKEKTEVILSLDRIKQFINVDAIPSADKEQDKLIVILRNLRYSAIILADIKSRYPNCLITKY